MAPHARVIIFDDDAVFVQTVTKELTDHGHTVIATAETIEDLKKILPTAKEADVALLDNVAPWRAGQEADDKGVGVAAENAVRDILGDSVVTIALTTTKNPRYGEYYYDARNPIYEALGPFVTGLPQKERK